MKTKKLKSEIFKPLFNSEQGQVFVLATIVLTLVMFNTLAIISRSVLFKSNTTLTVDSAQALNLAEAGIDKAVASLNATGGAYNGESETVVSGVGSYSVEVSSKDSTTKIVEATGFVPNKANPLVKKTVKILISKGIGAAFYYGIQVGEGGFEMSNNSVINGSVYSDGNITMANNAQITGDAYVAGGVQPTADQQSDCADPNCGDFIFGKSIGGQSQLDVAQSFEPTANNVLNKISLKLKKFGSPPDLTVRILGDNAGVPNKNQILGSATLTANLVTSSYGFVDIAFSPPISLSADTPYWILLDTTSDSANYWSWSEDTTQGYTRGGAYYSPDWQAKSPSWTKINADLGFRTYMGGVATSIIGSNGAAVLGNAHANTLDFLTIGQGAYYQSAQSISAKSYFPNSPDPATIPMPLSDGNIQEWKDSAAALGLYNGDITSCPSTLVGGKYVGSITLPSNCTVVVESPIWVTGNFTMSNSDIVKLDPSFNSASGTVVVDGTISMGNGNAIKGSGTTGSYLIVLSTYDSKDDPLQTPAINIINSGNTGIVYTNQGIINIANGNTLTQITGWKLILGNDVVINYDQGLASAFFSSGPGGSFSAIKGTYQAN